MDSNSSLASLLEIGSHRDAVAVKLWRRLIIRDLYKSLFWHTTTVPPCGKVACGALPINVPIILETLNFRVF